MTRRQILALGLAVPGACIVPLRAFARQDLSKFTAGAPACAGNRNVTPAVTADRHFKAGAPERVSLVETGVTGKKLKIKGAVIGLKCGPVKGALLEFWQADANGVYDDAGFRLRGRQTSDKDGAYHLETIVPGIAEGRARHISVKVQPPGKPYLVTSLFFDGDPSNAKDKSVVPDLLLKGSEDRDGGFATFDFIFDL
jgi:protocatechuate 3,4-dioxygenase beta subunit